MKEREGRKLKKNKNILFYYPVPSIFLILYNDQQMHNYFTNYHTVTCFDVIWSSSDSL